VRSKTSRCSEVEGQCSKTNGKLKGQSEKRWCKSRRSTMVITKGKKQQGKKKGGKEGK
jgi:hypothetical protein